MQENTAVSFAKSIKPDQAQEVLEMIKSSHDKPSILEQHPLLSKLELSNSEDEALQSIIEQFLTFCQKFDLPASFTSDITIDTKSVTIFTFEDDSFHPAASLSPDGKIILLIKNGTPIDSDIVKRLLVHELTHMASKTVWMKSGFDRYKVKQSFIGFERANYQENDVRSFGMYSEPLAELFSLFFLGEKKIVVESPYEYSVPFFIAFIKDLASRLETSEIEIFQQVFSSFIKRDFSIQRTIRDIYGRDFIKFLNTMKIGLNGEVLNVNEFEAFLNITPFKDSYQIIAEQYKTQGITFTGLSSKLKYKSET